jgi:hypothetical protein
MGLSGIRRSEVIQEVQTVDPAVSAYRHFRHMQGIANRHIMAHELKLTDAAMASTKIAEREFRSATPSTWRGVLLKANRACFYLAANQDYAAIDMVKEFFRRPTKQIDALWLAGLRTLIERVERYADEPGKAVECLKPIVQGKSGPRLV